MPPVNFRLLLVTDRHQVRGRALSTVLQHAIEAGVKAIQLRERDLSTRELLSLAKEMQGMTASRSVSLILNDRMDLAMALDLQGVHLRADSLSARSVRRIVGPGHLIGVSTHSAEDVRRAGCDGADYVVLGPIFDTPTKRSFGPPLGLGLLHEACRHSPIPIFAIGGITCERVSEVRQAGAYGVAVMGALLIRDDIGVAVHEFMRALEV
ncbi:MAG: thiamine phosphate synthase [Nitrospira sp.]|nr:thiamine phosphate synthase [Nitrospira sp.]